MNKREQINVSRRNCIKKAGALTLGAGLISTSTASNAQDNRKEPKWDEVVDIAILGSGFAGLAAGIQAKKMGAEQVTIFEKMPIYGGNSAINGGIFAVPNTPLQDKEGVKDSVDTMVRDQMKAGRGVASEALLRHVASNAIHALNLTLEAGVEYHPNLLQLGGHSQPRSYQTTVNCGAGITQPLLKYARKLGVTTENRCKFEEFIMDSAGTIIGVVIRKNYVFGREDSGSLVNVRAKKGVIVATGGFAQNIELRMAQDPTLTAEVGCTNGKGATGEAMLKMFQLGAVPVHLAHIQSGPWASPDEGGFGYVSNYSLFNFPHSAAIDRMTGRRFMNEIADRKTRADAELQRRDAHGNPLPPILITAEKQSKNHPSLEKVVKYGVGWKFDTLDEVAEKFNIPAKALKEQIKEYNDYVEKGEDRQFGKSMIKAKGKPIVAPYTVVKLWPKVHYCQGGVQINEKAEVIHSESKQPIPGLFAAGEVTGGVHGVSRLGSCAIPECLVMGMTAAKSVMSA